MKHWQYTGLLFLVVIVGSIGCGNHKAKLNEYLKELGQWVSPVVEVKDQRNLEVGDLKIDGVNYACEVSEESIDKELTSIIVAGTESNALWPGAVIQGKGLQGGELLAVPLEQGPVSLTVDLAIPEPSIAVDHPDAGSVQTAVATLQRSADARLGTIDIIPARIDYVRQEAYSFEQAVLSMGISMRYAGKLVEAGMDTAFNTERSVDAHTIMVKLYQPMYTISVGNELIPTPADHFAPNLSMKVVEEQQTLGRIGPGNLPLYVQSVTYGRMILFTLTNDQVSSAEDLIVAMDGAFKGFKTDAEVSTAHKQVLANSKLHLKVVGGNQQEAFEAISSGDLSKLFRPVYATTGVPLSFTLRTLDGKPASIRDTIHYQQQECVRKPTPKPQEYVFELMINNARNIYVYVNDNTSGKHIHYQQSGSTKTPLNLSRSMHDKENSVEVWTYTCFQNRYGDLALYRNKEAGWKHSVDSGSVVSCGWTAIAKFEMNKKTGTCEVLGGWGQIVGAGWKSCK
ncbi:MAG: thiol-activated cytolysin family protein [Candidatus Omnitrophica bacterium]|nr:thiol-activated cytolysin family protein [Candidatus Omnitrophota bacterium]